MRNKQENSDILQKNLEITTVSHRSDRTAMPPLNYVKFTSTSGNVICQRCKVSFLEGVELHFLHDMTGEGPGRNVCDECRQYYITKTGQSQARKF